MRFFFVIILSLFVVLPIKSQHQDAVNEICKQQLALRKNPKDLSALKNLCMQYLYRTDFNQAIYYGRRLESLSTSSKRNDYYHTYSQIILGQAYTMKENKSMAKKYLTKAKQLALTINNDSALCSAYNGLGLYASNLNRDYYSSLTNFYECLNIAKRCNYDKMSYIAKSNIAVVYYLRKDTMGLNLALDCFRQGVRHNDIYLIRNGAMTATFMYYLKCDYTKALFYNRYLEKYESQKGMVDQYDIFRMYGLIYSRLKQYNKAIVYFQSAISRCNNMQLIPDLELFVDYAQTLMNLNRLDEAYRVLRKGESFCEKYKKLIGRDDLYKTLSQYYEQEKSYSKALVYQHLYQVEKDSIFNANKEYAINDLETKYGTEKLKSEIVTARLEQSKREKVLMLMGAVLICIVIIAGTLYYLYRRKNTLYKTIVRQNLESIKREKSLESQIGELKKAIDDTEMKDNSAINKYTGSSLSSEKGVELFYRLESLMESEQIYQDNMITREKVADQLGTNRTYLSQAINEQTGKTFTQYVNEIRTREAVRQLSDPNNDIPLKALCAKLGFNSMTTFYSLFQNKVGMTPTQYRTSVNQLND